MEVEIEYAGVVPSARWGMWYSMLLIRVLYKAQVQENRVVNIVVILVGLFLLKYMKMPSNNCAGSFTKSRLKLWSALKMGYVVFIIDIQGSS